MSTVFRKSKAKLPDVIIALTTLVNKAKLVISDAGFRKGARLKITAF